MDGAFVPEIAGGGTRRGLGGGGETHAAAVRTAEEEVLRSHPAEEGSIHPAEGVLRSLPVGSLPAEAGGAKAEGERAGWVTARAKANDEGFSVSQCFPVGKLKGRKTYVASLLLVFVCVKVGGQ